MKEIYVIYGPQGSGKSTQTKLLEKELDLRRVATGEISREIARHNETLREILKRGEPTPQEIIVPAVDEVMEQNKDGKGFVFDGYPRFAQQIESFITSIENHRWEITKVIVIKLTKEVGIKRIMDRMVAEGREDDNPQAISRRLELYDQQTVPIIDYFKTLDKVVEVDGSGTIGEVHDSILRAIGK